MTTEEQLAILTTKLKDLETQLGQLSKVRPTATPGTGTSAAGTTPNIQVSVPQEKQFGKYGRARDDRVLEDWISDVQRAVSGQSDGEAVDTLIFHLEGVPRKRRSSGQHPSGPLPLESSLS